MVSSAVTLFTLLFSVLVPQKMWYAPNQALTITNKSGGDVTLELTDFSGKAIAAKGSADVAASQSADLKTIFPDTSSPGTFVLYALAKGSSPSQAGPPKDFLGTPLVIEVLPQMQQPQAAVVTHVLPLQYAVMTTESGPLTEVFYYDAAPHTVDNFLALASGGYYDGLVFHRVVPGFVIQGGDPLGADSDPQKRGTGGPGYTIIAEFSDKPHSEGVLSMARAGDPNSAGSQFFICLNYANTQQLDHQYTAFGKVVDGMDAVKSIAGAKVQDEKPDHPAAITKVEVFPVTAQKDPYASIMSSQGK
ncbi:MAG: peptidylprolyl isomerase [Tepidisphaeraceae bacterium]|jgi:cyclophilin family peptidyl-prolyl cis-trans isomerase